MKSHKAKQQFHFLRSLQIEKKNFSFTKDNIQNGSFFKFDQALRLNTKILSPIRKISKTLIYFEMVRKYFKIFMKPLKK